jgi:hypothetical protein
MPWPARLGRRRPRLIVEHAYILIGMWPSPEAGAKKLITVLEQIAVNTDIKDTRTRAEKRSRGCSVGLASSLP